MNVGNYDNSKPISPEIQGCFVLKIREMIQSSPMGWIGMTIVEEEHFVTTDSRLGVLVADLGLVANLHYFRLFQAILAPNLVKPEFHFHSVQFQARCIDWLR